MNFNGHFFLSSAKKFLSDTAISFTILFILLLTNFSKFADINVPDGLGLPISIVVIFLSYTFGLFVNASSHFLFSLKIEDKIQKKIFYNENRAQYTKKFFRKQLTYPFFRINNNKKDENSKDFYTFRNVAEILGNMSFVFRKIDKNIDYVEGLSQYVRNICFVLPIVDLILIISMICDKKTNICYILLILFTWPLIELFLHLSAHLYFYYNSFTIYMGYLVAKTLLSYREDEDENLYPTSGEAESAGELIAYRVIKDLAFFSFPNEEKVFKIQIDSLKVDPNQPSNYQFNVKLND